MSTRQYIGFFFVVLLAGALLLELPTIPIHTVGEFVKEASKPVASTPSELQNSIYFLGDIMLARDVERRILSAGFDFPFARISFPENVYVVGNFESAVPRAHTSTPNNTFKFSTRKEFLPLLTQLGVTHLSLANNHAFDFGLAGYNSTVSALWETSIVPFGHPTVVASSSVVHLVLAGGTVGILSLHTLFTEPDKALISAQLQQLRDVTDVQVVFVHWGEEYTVNPRESERELAEFLVAAGVDLVVGHHPHVVQKIERVAGVPVIYSLGNFIFDQYFSKQVEEGLVVRLVFESTPYIELMPITSLDAHIQPRFMDAEEKNLFLQEVASSTESTLAVEIRRGRIEL